MANYRQPPLRYPPEEQMSSFEGSHESKVVVAENVRIVTKPPDLPNRLGFPGSRVPKNSSRYSNHRLAVRDVGFSDAPRIDSWGRRQGELLCALAYFSHVDQWAIRHRATRFLIRRSELPPTRAASADTAKE
jgi:hypothetical protein